RLTGHRGAVQELVYSADGKLLATAGFDTTILLWDLSGGHDLSTADAPAPRPVDSLWTDLAAGSAALAFQARGRLTADPDRAIDVLKKSLPPARRLTIDPKAIHQMILELDSPKFRVRETANHALELLGKAALPELQKALATAVSLEAQQRLEKMITRLEQE